MKKVLSLLLAVVMVIGLFPIIPTAASAAGATQLASFALGANGSATHNDGTGATTYTETNNGYTLSIANGVKMYTGARDAKGNSCLKFGTSNDVGSCSFTVPADVTEVVISVAKYKTNTAKINVNGTAYTLTKNSNNGEYDEIIVDTTTEKTVTFATVSGGARAMMNTIVFNNNGNEGGETGHTCVWDNGTVTKPATCTEDGVKTYSCTVDGCTETRTEVIEATGHNYVDGICSGCGTADPTSGIVAVDAPVAGVAYKFGMRQNALTEKPLLLITGAMNGYYAATTTEYDNAVDTYLEETDGGYYIYTLSGTTKQYINIVVSGTYYNFKYEAAASSVWTLNTEYQYVKTTASDGTEVYLGTYGTNQTVGGSKTSFISDTSTIGVSQFCAWFYAKESTGDTTCTHTNTTTTTVDASCTAAGSTTVTCNDCGGIISTTVIDIKPHNFVNGTCTGCGETETSTSVGFVLAEAIAVGDTIVIVSEGVSMELTSFSTTSTVYGVGTAYTTTPAGTMTWTVEAGTVSGSFAFVNADGKYLSWSSGNSLKTSASKGAQESWKVSFNGTDVILVNAGTVDAARHVAWNKSSPRFANYKDTTLTGQSASYPAIQFYKYTTVDGCVHEVAEDAWNIVTAATCEAEGLKSGKCSKCGETVTKDIPATGHTYTYGETGVGCTECDFNQPYNTIAEAKAYTDTNKVYFMKGIVTYVKDTNVYMEDATGGVCVFFTNTAKIDIAVGDQIVVWDTMTKYNGLIETTYTQDTEYTKMSTGNTLPVQTVTLAQLKADTTNEYLGERVTIENVTIGTINTSGNTALTDADGNTINLYKATGLSSDIVAGDTVTVTVVVSTYNGYQLLVNPGTAATDVVKVVAEENFAVYTGATEVATFATMNEALKSYDPATSYIKVLEDADVEITLASDLYIDVNGKALTGTIIVGQYKIYGMDSTTDGYTCDAMGYLACVDEDGNDVIPETMVKTSVTGAVRRYLTIEDPNMGFTFHRFYLGVTHANVKPGVKGVGYKAVFAGDDMVKAQITSYGYTLQLEGNNAITRSKAGSEMVSLETVALSVKDYNVEKYGESGLSVSVFMVIGKETVTTDTVTMSLREMVEAINEQTLTDEQKTAVAAWIAESETMQGWKVDNIYTKGGVTVPDFEPENQL